MGKGEIRSFLKSAAAVILMHNDPTGDPTPSTEDLLREAGDMIGIRVLDRIIIGCQHSYG